MISVCISWAISWKWKTSLRLHKYDGSTSKYKPQPPPIVHTYYFSGWWCIPSLWPLCMSKTLHCYTWRRNLYSLHLSCPYVCPLLVQVRWSEKTSWRFDLFRIRHRKIPLSWTFGNFDRLGKALGQRSLGNWASTFYSALIGPYLMGKC